MTLKILHNRDELDDIASEWDQAVDSSNDSIPTQSYIWSLACADVFTGGLGLSIFFLESEQNSYAIAPLVYHSKHGGFYTLLGVAELKEPSDLLYQDTPSLSALVSVLGNIKVPLFLDRIRGDSITLPLIKSCLRRKAIVIERKLSNYPYINLTGNNVNIDTLLPARLRSDLRRAQRKAEQLGRVFYEVHAPKSDHEFISLFEEAQQIEASGWKGRSGTALSQNLQQRDFYLQYGKYASRLGILRLAFMRLDSQLIAMQYCVEFNHSLWLLKIGFNEEFSQCSPGMLLMLETLKYSLNNGLKRYEFLGSAEPWTKRWTTSETPTSRLEIYPFSFRGMTAFCIAVTRYIAIKASNFFPHK